MQGGQETPSYPQCFLDHGVIHTRQTIVYLRNVGNPPLVRTLSMAQQNSHWRETLCVGKQEILSHERVRSGQKSYECVLWVTFKYISKYSLERHHVVQQCGKIFTFFFLFVPSQTWIHSHWKENLSVSATFDSMKDSQWKETPVKSKWRLCNHKPLPAPKRMKTTHWHEACSL